MTLQKERFDHKRMESECESLKIEIEKLEKQLADQNSQSSMQRSEIEKLNVVIAEAEQVWHAHVAKSSTHRSMLTCSSCDLS